MKLSRTTRRNPTQTKTLQNNYVLALLILLRKFRTEAVDALEQSGRMMSVSRELAFKPTEINISWLNERLIELGLATIVFPGNEIVESNVQKDYAAGATFATTALKRIGIEAVIGQGPADWRVIDALKVRNLSALRGITEEMNKQIIAELTDGINKGESIPKLAKRIEDRTNKIGKVRATVMARTETLYAFNQAAELRYAQHGIEKLEWLTAHDERLCDQCAPLDGKVFDMKSRHERPPLHPNCRCTLIPVIEK